MKSFMDRFKYFGFAFAVLSILTLGITGCSSGGSANVSPTTNDEGELVISLTDATGDFIHYTVDVSSLTLTKLNGTVVTVLPLSTRIDFAEYTEMTEFLTAATIPSGTYTEATLTLNYADAFIEVENENGDPVQITDIVDEDGLAVSTLQVTVQLEGRNSLTILPGVPAHLMLDFDLQASNHVEFSNENDPVLTVQPILIVDVNRTDPHKLHRIRGLLDEVNLNDSSFSVILRPFYSALADTHRLFGIRSVMTDSETIFHVDGIAYEGSDEGLTALGRLDPLAPVAALGSLGFNPLRFEAWEVYAGSSVPGADFDAVSGWVTSRTDNTLTVKGASLIRSGSSVIFNDEVTVQIAESTVVQRQVSSDTYSIGDISVGQHITAFGTMTSLEPENLEMDATGGLVRMMITTVRGTVVSVNESDPAEGLILDLQSIGKFRVGNFDFTGTGASGIEDADPNNYEIYTATMDLSAVEAGTAVKLKGFVEPFGMAPPDFAAFALIDVSDLRAVLRTNWMPPTDTPFTEMSAASLVLNLEGTGMVHHLVRGCVVTDLLDLPLAPEIIPDEDGEGLYVLKYNSVTEIHTVFEDFVDRIGILLGDGYGAVNTSAIGFFDDATAVLEAHVIEIQFRTL